MTKKKEQPLSQDNDLLLDEASLQYIHDMGDYFKKNGYSRVGGDTIGLLIVSHRALNIDEIAKRLGVSRTSVVTSIQLLQMVGLVEVAPRRRGDRREYYQLATDGWQQVMNAGVSRVKQMLKLIADGQRIVAQDNLVSRRHLREIKAYYEYWLEALGQIDEGWKKRRAELGLDDDNPALVPD